MPVDYGMFMRDVQTKRGHGNAARSHNNGGGVLLAVKWSLNSRGLEIAILGSKWIVIVIYRPPNANPEYWDFVQSNIDGIQSASVEYQWVMITDDLNADLMNEQPHSVASHLLSVFETIEMSPLVL